jgi:23S rRNA pseudouridine1911/1915/1917 synthase
MEYQANESISLTDVLTRLAPGSSKSAQRNWVKVGRVTIDGRLVSRFDTPIEPGQKVRLAHKSKPLYQDLRIVYEDKHLVVIDKPKGLLSVASNFETQKTAHNILKEHYAPQRVFVIHRLDQDTSGVMLFGLSDEGFEGLKDDFKTHSLQRLYIAIVEGHLEEGQGTWTSYLWEDAAYRVHSTNDPERGEKAITHFEVKATSRRYSWMELTLETGKKNQIRIHCQEAGHPIVGDTKYGASSNPLKRLCLHAHVLAFHHPVTKKWMKFIAPPPDEFFKLVNPKGRHA